jgi:hypothetical protein
MSDNQQISEETRALLHEMLIQLAAIYDASNLKQGIYFGAVLGERGFTLKFERDTTIDGTKSNGDRQAS